MTGINRDPLINYIMWGNFSPWQILSIRCLLICVLSGPGRYLNGIAPYFTNVSVVIRFVFCPPYEVKCIFQLQAGPDACDICLFCFKHASFKKQIGTRAPESGI